MLLLMSLSTIAATAYSFKVDGIYYEKIIDNNVKVTYIMYYDPTRYISDYSGDVIIPNVVSYNGITYSVVAIGEHAFHGCTDLTSVNIPSSVTTIGASAFHGCISLTSIDIPNTVTSIGNGAFKGCSSLTGVVIPSSIKWISEGTFENCSSLTSVNIPSSVTKVYQNAFYGCIELKKVNISSLEAWCKINFNYYSNPLIYAQHLYLNGTEVKDLIIPNSITNIGQRTFQNCKGLTSVTIPNTTKTIGFAAFQHCSGLTSITIPQSITAIENLAFQGCTSITTLYYNAISDIVFSDIGSEGPFYNLNITSINIGDSVRTIPNGFAYGLTKLSNVNIGKSVTKIGREAFYDCSELTSVSIPNSVTFIGDGAFIGCRSLTKVNISSLEAWCGIIFGVNSSSTPPSSNPLCIAHHLYLNESEIKHLVIPNSVTKICSNAFYGCKGLLSVVIPSSVTSIGGYAFYDCTNLNYVISVNKNPPSGYYHMFPNHQLIYVPNRSLYGSYWSQYNIRDIYKITPRITSAVISSNNNDIIKIKKAVLKNNDGQPLDIFYANDSNLVITNLMPDHSTQKVTISIVVDDNEYEIDDTFQTEWLSFTEIYSTSTTQTTLTPTFAVSRDDGLLLDACGVVCNSEIFTGSVTETTDDSYIIECHIPGLTPNSRYSLRPWIQYKGVKYYGNYKTLKTDAIEVDNNATVTPTSVYLVGSYSSPGDAVITDAYFTFNGEKMETLYQTGLNPNTSYNYTYTIETTSGNQVTNNSFRTPTLSMEAQSVRMLTNTTVMFEALTNMIDDETMVGFEWRRYDAPSEMPSTQVYSPVFDGKIAGTLKNLAENVYYKYRPFYKSNSDKYYYGNWVAFITADAGVEYEPVVYTYNSPVVTQTEATLQGVALRGSDEITEQGFEYWKTGNNPVTKIIATGERMSKKVSGLQSGEKYTFRAFVTSGGETRYGNEVEFMTLSNSFDVNLDGEVNIADINAVIDIILSSSSNNACDVNGDGEVNIADINAIINIILR